MKVRHALTGALVVLVAAAPASSPAAVRAPCKPLAKLLSEARADFGSLRQKKFDRAACSHRRSEFKCRWGFPGDAYAAAEAETAKLTRCMSELPGASPREAKRSQTAFEVEPNMSVVIGGPELDSGEWAVELKIVSTAAAR